MTANSSQRPLESATTEVLKENEFLQSVPPGQAKRVLIDEIHFPGSASTWGEWKPNDLLLHCTSDECGGIRFFRTVTGYEIKRTGHTQLFITFSCRNCTRSRKCYALSITRNEGDGSTEMYKFGELPLFGPPNPAKLMNLMGSERDAYLKGRRCENQGLGIAAFAYYRRVVESQKSKIIGEICKVAERLNSDPSLIEELKAAKHETRFTEALNRVKHGLPPVLLIDGHNPLTLLHSALSEGLHATSDEDCLEIATSIRVVLTELVERMATAVKEEAELTSAVQRLLKGGGKKS